MYIISNVFILYPANHWCLQGKISRVNQCTANDDILEGQKLSVGFPAFPNHHLECFVNALFGPG